VIYKVTKLHPRLKSIKRFGYYNPLLAIGKEVYAEYFYKMPGGIDEK